MDGEVEDVQVETNKAEQARENMVDDHLRGRERERERWPICVVHSWPFSAIATIIPYSQKIWRFGSRCYNRQIKIHHNFLLTYIIHMAIPYRTAKFKSANILPIAILGSTSKFNSRQYFWLYGIYIFAAKRRSRAYHVSDYDSKRPDLVAKVNQGMTMQRKKNKPKRDGQMKAKIVRRLIVEWLTKFPETGPILFSSRTCSWAPSRAAWWPFSSLPPSEGSHRPSPSPACPSRAVGTRLSRWRGCPICPTKTRGGSSWSKDASSQGGEQPASLA